ncbi:MAG TPA: pyrimidine dimer DNA glycosylase/endonuclease V [Rhodocyclaceae bacterium]|nr:pyrimidine dimer DNA glycosylase/endonuclease V [Rhodocyclaceae bacterium]
MRLWSLHPRYLDSRGLVALWREALLAQAVLGGQTRGYRHHPQLMRFCDAASPMDAIAAYLHAVHAEAVVRNFRFDAKKILCGGHGDAAPPPVAPIAVTYGQLDYEWEHLAAKLRMRDAVWLARLVVPPRPQAHPLFQPVPGPVADWEIVRASR